MSAQGRQNRPFRLLLAASDTLGKMFFCLSQGTLPSPLPSDEAASPARTLVSTDILRQLGLPRRGVRPSGHIGGFHTEFSAQSVPSHLGVPACRSHICLAIPKYKGLEYHHRLRPHTGAL